MNDPAQRDNVSNVYFRGMSYFRNLVVSSLENMNGQDTILPKLSSDLNLIGGTITITE